MELLHRIMTHPLSFL